MKFSLIICTYQRAQALICLLNSVLEQTLYPDEIIIVDGSLDSATEIELTNYTYPHLLYTKVGKKNRGLTKQRNFGISKVSSDMDIVCFLDDDVILELDYFEKLLETYKIYPQALGIGGYISNEVNWKFKEGNEISKINEFYYDGWKRKDGSRFVLRKRLGLDSDCAPGFSPLYSHGRSVSFLPPSEKIYEVEQIMGGVSSFKTSIFETIKFSTYFEGYGLYEDADFSLRVAKTGKLYVNTAAKLSHYHNPTGRPNMYQYGKMVVRNGWYVWRVKNPKPASKDIFKWHSITILLLIIRFTNSFTTENRKDAILESFGRKIGWMSLLWNPPK